MWKQNSTSWQNFDVDTNFPVLVRVVLVSTTCLAASFGNILVLLIFSVSYERQEVKGERRYAVVDIILAALGIAGFIRGIFPGPLQIASFINGHWIFGPSACQIQAYVEATLRNALLWSLALLSVERYTMHMVPHEYLITFSPLTVSMILPGILLVVIIQATAPLYGWGKYGYLSDIGMCGLQVESNFVCSYALYLICTLTLPPIIAIILIWAMITVNSIKNSAPDETYSRNLSFASSRLWDTEKEMLSLFLYTFLFVSLIAPRYIVDTAVMCDCLESPFAAYSFLINFLDSLTSFLLPILCLCFHQNFRLLLYGLFRTNSSLSRGKSLTRTPSSLPLDSC